MRGMMTKEGLVAPERSVLLKEWLGRHGIKAVIFDLDDTLLDTHALIEEKLNAFKLFFHEHFPEKAPEELDRLIDEADMKVFETHSVSNERWNGLTTLVMASCGGTSDLYQQGAGILLSMYDESPKPFPGASETVRAFRSAVPHLGVVTHANEAYTNLKLATTGFGELFDHVQIADEWGHKSADDWKQAIQALGVQPREALVIGDSVRGDMRAAREAGVIHLVNLPSPWEVYRLGDLPEGVMRVEKIDAVIPSLLRNP